MTHKPHPLLVAMVLLPLLGFFLAGLLIFAWPLFVVAVALLVISSFLSLFKRRRRAMA
ncbi:MAG: hypothetical protein Q9P14_14980 [candidate division KSB1 bacterium]|nr:hypothetical protein [candidate division KSB1 bacterium]MDQ7065135.1 hypothetical protein [candidate division KSB1 bacterium]